AEQWWPASRAATSPGSLHTGVSPLSDQITFKLRRAGRCGTLFGPLEDEVPAFSCSDRNSTPLVVLTTECPSGLPARGVLLAGGAERVRVGPGGLLGVGAFPGEGGGSGAGPVAVAEQVQARVFRGRAAQEPAPRPEGRPKAGTPDQ